jgi:hypothetical protein
MRLHRNLGRLCLFSIATTGLFLSLVAATVQAASPVGSAGPTGPFSVGRTLLYWVDSHRTDPVDGPPGTKREFMVIIWYPAERQTSAHYAPWMPERWASSEASFLYNQRRDSANPLTMSQAQEVIQQAVSNSVTDAPMSSAQRSWPVLLFSPGAGVNAAFYSTFTEDMASHGYVVFGIEPTGWVATAFPDGHEVPPSGRRSDDLAWITGTALPLWADDLRFMLDEIEKLDRGSQGVFSHRLDLRRIGAFGHSFGGAASISAGTQDQRIKAVLNLDGSPFGVLSKQVLRKPFMVIKHDISAKYAIVPPDDAGKAMQAHVEEELSSVYLRGQPGYRVAVTDAKHMTFSDMAVLPTWSDAGRRFGIEDADDGARTLKGICAYIEAFFDEFLLGKSSSLIDHPMKSGIFVVDSTARPNHSAVPNALNQN